jgi:hypothetical protein
MDVCVVFVERTVAWNVKSDMKEEKDIKNSTKMDQKGENPGQAKNKKIPPEAWMSVLSVVCSLVEVSASG